MNELVPARLAPPPSPDLAYPAYGPMEDYGAPEPSAGLKRFLTFLRRYWWVPALTLILSLTAALNYIIFLAPPAYVSSARMWETEKLNLPGGAAFSEDIQSYLGTQIELLRSGKIWQLALARLQATGTNTVPLDKEGRPPKVTLKVIQAPKSTVFVVQASSSNPSFSQGFLNAVMGEYLDYKKNIRKLVSGDTLASISEQVLRLERDLKTEQEALTTFQRTNNLAILEEEGRVAGGYLARLKTQVSDYQLESKLLDATAFELKSFEGNTNASSFPGDTLRGTSSPSASSASTEHQTAFKELELLKMQRAKLSKYLRPKHPKIVKLDADIERGQRLIELYHNQSREQLDSNRQALKMRIESVQSSIKEWESKVTEANGRIAEAERLKLNVNRTQVLYDRLVSLLQNVDISRNIDQENLAILELASVSERSYRLEIIIGVLALFGGLALGMGIVFLVEVRDDRLTSLAEVTTKLTDCVFGQVPDMGKLRGKIPLALLNANDERHAYAEAYRSLRSALIFLPYQHERPRIFLITSAIPNEGKSTIAANLARTLALGGSRVLLVDGDMRKGRLAEVLGLQREPGLSDMLRSSGELPNVIQTTSLSNLAFISRGGSLHNPGDLLLRPNLDEILARWRNEFDYVLIDSSPVFGADDASTLAPKVDGTVFVVRNRHSPAGAVQEALQLLYQRQAKVVGVIYNAANTSGRSYYQYKYADYGQTPKNAGLGG